MKRGGGTLGDYHVKEVGGRSGGEGPEGRHAS